MREIGIANEKSDKTGFVVSALVLALSIVVLFPLCGTSLGVDTRVGIVADAGLGKPAEYGLTAIEESLRKRDLSVQRLEQIASPQADFLIIAGLTSPQGAAVRELKVLNVPLPEGPEALVVRRTEIEGKPAVILCGSDARGLMYAALDLSDRIAWNDGAGNPFAQVGDACEKPYLLDRSVSIYTMQRAYFESRLYDETYWQRYFGLLARSRINSFVVIFGYENGGFMAPAIPLLLRCRRISSGQADRHHPRAAAAQYGRVPEDDRDRSRTRDRLHHRHLGPHLSGRRPGGGH